MDQNEAMRLFTRTLEEDEPAWYSYMDDPRDSANGHSHSKGNALAQLPGDDSWRTPWITTADKHPYPRFEHSCCLLGQFMFLFGGNCGVHLPWRLHGKCCAAYTGLCCISAADRHVHSTLAIKLET